MVNENDLEKDLIARQLRELTHSAAWRVGVWRLRAKLNLMRLKNVGYAGTRISVIPTVGVEGEVYME